MVRLRFRRRFAWPAPNGAAVFTFRPGEDRLVTDLIAQAALAAGAAVIHPHA